MPVVYLHFYTHAAARIASYTYFLPKKYTEKTKDDRRMNEGSSEYPAHRVGAGIGEVWMNYAGSYALPPRLYRQADTQYLMPPL